MIFVALAGTLIATDSDTWLDDGAGAGEWTEFFKAAGHQRNGVRVPQWE